MGEVSFQFPQVLRGGVVFPFDEELMPSSGMSVCDDHFYFIFGFSFQEVCSVDIIFFVRGEKGGVEDGMYPPLHQEL